ncbi:hypothetical protein [Acidianus infernus]
MPKTIREEIGINKDDIVTIRIEGLNPFSC